MSNVRMTVRAKLLVAATTVAAAALPFQAGVAHAETPNQNLATCIRAAEATMSDTFSADIDACVDQFIAELGIDSSTTVPVATTDDSGGTAVDTTLPDTAASDATVATDTTSVS